MLRVKGHNQKAYEMMFYMKKWNLKGRMLEIMCLDGVAATGLDELIYTTVI